jgi:hypothetical protein
MSIEGFYAITFRGNDGWGIGMVIFRDGAITGADAGGVLYDGYYADRGEHLDLNARIRVPPGVGLVQGVAGQPAWSSYDFTAVVPKRALDSNEPVRMELPNGPVNVIFRRVRPIP